MPHGLSHALGPEGQILRMVVGTKHLMTLIARVLVASGFDSAVMRASTTTVSSLMTLNSRVKSVS